MFPAKIYAGDCCGPAVSRERVPGWPQSFRTRLWRWSCLTMFSAFQYGLNCLLFVLEDQSQQTLSCFAGEPNGKAEKRPSSDLYFLKFNSPDAAMTWPQSVLGDAVFFYGDQCMHWISPVVSGRRAILQMATWHIQQFVVLCWMDFKVYNYK